MEIKENEILLSPIKSGFLAAPLIQDQLGNWTDWTGAHCLVIAPDLGLIKGFSLTDNTVLVC